MAPPSMVGPVAASTRPTLTSFGRSLPPRPQNGALRQSCKRFYVPVMQAMWHARYTRARHTRSEDVLTDVSAIFQVACEYGLWTSSDAPSSPAYYTHIIA